MLRIFLVLLVVVTCQAKEYTAGCYYARDDFAMGWGNQYSCHIRLQVNRFDADPVVEAIEGPDSDYEKSKLSIEAVYIVDQQLPYLLSGLGVLYLNLKSFRAERSHIKFIRSKNFIGMENLINLQLDNNEIEEIPSDTFSYLNKLEWLSLGSNKIRIFDPSTFNGLCNLKRLSFSRNLVTSLHDDIFQYNSKLETILGNDNQLTHFENAIKHLTNLKTKDFSGNPIRS